MRSRPASPLPHDPEPSPARGFSTCPSRWVVHTLLPFFLLLGLVPVADAHWQRFRRGDGLAGDRVFDMVEGHDEILWMATERGLSRYDGNRWTTLMPDTAVLAVYEDRSGAIWAGNPIGLWRFDSTGRRQFTTQDGLPGSGVRTIFQDSSGAFWFSTGGGVTRYDGTSWRTFTTADGLADNSVTSIAQDLGGKLWFGTHSNGVSRYDGTSWVTFTQGSGTLAGNDVQDVLADRSGAVWVASIGGLVRIDPDGSVLKFSGTELGFSDAAYSLWQDRWGAVWVGTSVGVTKIDLVHLDLRHWTLADGLSGGVVHAIAEDRSGGMWFGTESDGVSRFTQEGWTEIPMPDTLFIGYVPDMAVLPGFGFLYVTDYGVGVTIDGTLWQFLTTDNGLPSNHVSSLLWDPSGELWVGTDAGVTRFNVLGSEVVTYTVSDGLGSNFAGDLLLDSKGNKWLATRAGVSRFDGSAWRSFTTADGLGDSLVFELMEDRAGNIWAATGGGASRFDGSSWRNYTTADGLPFNVVYSVAQDSTGALWFGTEAGATRFDGTQWRIFTIADGLSSNVVRRLFVDSGGGVWANTGLPNRYDGQRWMSFTQADGVSRFFSGPFFDDGTGRIHCGRARYELDRVPPQTVFVDPPLPISTSPTQRASFVAAYGEVGGIEASTSLDHAPFSDWAFSYSWFETQLADGVHDLRVRTRDEFGNEDPTPAEAVFEIDATPPAPQISSPFARQAVRDSIVIAGTAADPRFRDYRVEFRALNSSVWQEIAPLSPQTMVVDGALAGWNTRPQADGDYELRLSVLDTLGLTGTAVVRVIVDNEAPFIDVTSPAKVTAADGGDVFTTGKEAHVYFAPHAFAEDATVTLDAVAESELRPRLDSATRAIPGYRVDWGAVSMTKPSTLDLALPDTLLGRSVAIWDSLPGEPWRRIGGTTDRDRKQISAPISAAATFAVFEESGSVQAGIGLSELALSPRVLSHRAGVSSSELAISFTLGEAAPVTVRVYNRAGRLVREVASGRSMGPGANIIRWDGRDESGSPAEHGLYLVTVEALGSTRKQALAVAP